MSDSNYQHTCYNNVNESAMCGSAIDMCYSKGLELWVTNDEYCSKVRFCPFCGEKSPEFDTKIMDEIGDKTEPNSAL